MLDLLAAFRPHHGGQKEEIIKLLDEIVKLTEDRLREGGIERHYRVYLATKLEGKADFLQRHGEHAEAEKLFRQALTHYDDLFRRLKLGHNHEAVRALCRIRLGERFEEQKRLAEAEQVYRVALDDLAHGAWGQRWNALTHLISVLIRQKRPDAAASRLAQHIASAREEAQAAPAQLGLTLELVAAELMRAESAGEASVSVRGALARLELPAWSDPKATAEHLSNYAWQMARPAGSPLPRTAVALAEEAARLAPDLFDMHRLLGIARYRARDYAGAAASLKRSLELKPNENITGSLFLAMALRHQGNAAEARKWHEKAAAWIAGQKSVPEQLKELEKEAKALLGLDGPPPAVKRTPTE
jgi:tetratricopeptide (TPR) repeat protein